jgi:hypothetical protein
MGNIYAKIIDGHITLVGDEYNNTKEFKVKVKDFDSLLNIIDIPMMI